MQITYETKYLLIRVNELINEIQAIKKKEDENIRSLESDRDYFDQKMRGELLNEYSNLLALTESLNAISFCERVTLSDEETAFITRSTKYINNWNGTLGSWAWSS